MWPDMIFGTLSSMKVSQDDDLLDEDIIRMIIMS